MIKPRGLNRGDTIATVSPSWGCAGDRDVRWKYELGVKRLEQLGLKVVSAPNSLKGEKYLENHPEKRAEDLMWAFENRNVNAIIANIGGNDSERLLPFLSPDIIINNPKIFCGYSDIMTLHLFFNQLGLMTYYGDNLLTTVAEATGWNPYSEYWFKKVFFNNAMIGEIEPSDEWSYSENNHTDKSYIKTYIKNDGYRAVQGKGKVRGKLIGGHSGMMEYSPDSLIQIRKETFKDKILFFEDIPECFDINLTETLFEWLGANGYLQELRGLIIGKQSSPFSFEPFAQKICEIVSGRYGLQDLPILYGLNFGHSNPIFILPYGAEAELDIDHCTFSILESGVE